MILGYSIYNADIDVAFLQIPKNVSSSFRSLKDKGPWKECYVQKLHEHTRVNVILRDPTQRFISAINMYLKTQGNLFAKPITFVDYMEKDQHFVRQCKFLEPLRNFQNIDYFYYNYDVVDQINHHYDLDLNPHNRLNKSTEKAVTQVDPEFIHKHYQEDLDLIKTITFINKRQ